MNAPIYMGKNDICCKISNSISQIILYLQYVKR